MPVLPDEFWCNNSGLAWDAKGWEDERGHKIMPRIFEQDGYTFFFYSNDHTPIHVHVRYGGGEAVFIVEDEIELRESHGLKVTQLARAEELARSHRTLILEKWHEHFGG